MKVNTISRGELILTVALIRMNLSDDLRKRPWKGHWDFVAGHCYVASEAFYHIMGGMDYGWKPMFIRHHDAPHWYITHKDWGRVDITASQFDEPVHYPDARGKGFLTKKPSARAQILIDRVQHIIAAGARCVEGGL